KGFLMDLLWNLRNWAGQVYRRTNRAATSDDLLYASRSTGVTASLVSWEYILTFCFVRAHFRIMAYPRCCLRLESLDRLGYAKGF
ncbi:20556_t:CDS:2, partial [Rhizophagus irregularis]